jgi:hypothetical protein
MIHLLPCLQMFTAFRAPGMLLLTGQEGMKVFIDAKGTLRGHRDQVHHLAQVEREAHSVRITPQNKFFVSQQLLT